MKVVVYNNGSTTVLSSVKEKLVKHLSVVNTFSKSVDKTTHPILRKKSKGLSIPKSSKSSS